MKPDGTLELGDKVEVTGTFEVISYTKTGVVLKSAQGSVLHASTELKAKPTGRGPYTEGKFMIDGVPVVQRGGSNDGIPT